MLQRALKDNKTAKISWAVPWGKTRLEKSAEQLLKSFVNTAKTRRGIGFMLKIVIAPGTAPAAPPGRESLPLALAAPTPTGRRP